MNRKLIGRLVVILSEILDKENVKIITLANRGYLHFTRNCIKSLEKLEIRDLLKVYCADKECYDELRKDYQNIEMIDSEYNKNVSGLCKYPRSDSMTNTNFKNVVFLKFVAIHDALKSSNVLFVDSDVVFLGVGFLEYLIDNIKDNEILFQSETNGAGENEPCSGLMYMKNTSEVKNFFDPSVVICDKKWIENVGDQDYVRENKNKLRHDYMDVKLFPNGRYFQKYRSEINPYMVHYNWCRPKQKLKIMSRTGGWFL